MRKTGFVIGLGIWLLAGTLVAAQQQPQIQEEVTVSWWLVPVYAVDKAGAPVLDLAPEDLGIYIKGFEVEQFSLIKKQFQITEAGKPAPALPAQPSAPAQKKMAFLVFDAAFSPYKLLAKSKAIADTILAQSDKAAQYVLLSIEPFAGLNYIAGPTRDLKLITKKMDKYVVGKKSEYLFEANAMDKNEIQDPYPPGDARNPASAAGRGGLSGTRGGMRNYATRGLDSASRNTWKDKKRVAASYTSSLMTLDLVLGVFKEYSKVIYLYSCGIPDDALLNRTEWVSRQPASLTEPPEFTVSLTADMVAYDTLTTIGRHLNTSGAILFVVNPSGTRIDESDSASGEQSLRILANESGGRYFEGAEKDIAKEVNSIEGGYYEISFPDQPEYEGRELDFEIRSNRPDVQILTVKKVGREKRYADMSELEKEVIILNILNQGPFAQANQKVSFVEALDVLQDGDWLICEVPLPPELARSEWQIFKIARNFDTGRIYIDKDKAVPSATSIQTRMKWRGQEFRHDLVFSHAKTGTILIWQ
jgi:hypothetical protein